MSKRIKKEEKQSNINVPGLIITIILVIVLCLLGFFIIGRFSKPSSDDITENESAIGYNRLLKVLNDNVKTTKIEGEKEATTLLSFSYNENHFYISAYNEDIIYFYDADVSKELLTSLEDAYNFVLNNDLEGDYDISLDRYTEVTSNEFVAKYGSEGKYKVGTLGTTTKVFGLVQKESSIEVFNGVDLTTALDDSYTSMSFKDGDSLYPVYNYIVSK